MLFLCHFWFLNNIISHESHKYQLVFAFLRLSVQLRITFLTQNPQELSHNYLTFCLPGISPENEGCREEMNESREQKGVQEGEMMRNKNIDLYNVIVL